MSEVAKAAGSYLSSLQQLGAQATPGKWKLLPISKAIIDPQGNPIGWKKLDEGYASDAEFVVTARNCWEALVNVAAAADEWVGVKGALTHSGKIAPALAALRAAVEGERKP